MRIVDLRIPGHARAIRGIGEGLLGLHGQAILREHERRGQA
jgi:hypothetical protein